MVRKEELVAVVMRGPWDVFSKMVSIACFDRWRGECSSNYLSVVG